MWKKMQFGNKSHSVSSENRVRGNEFKLYKE